MRNQSCFNSILVRLKVTEDPKSRGIIVELFQFHTGSIKRLENIGTFRLIEICFNSILVRLKVKVNSEAPLYEDMTEFQFHTGSIKRLL